MEDKINVIPLNDIDKSILEFLQISLRNIFNKEICIVDTHALKCVALT